LDEVGCKTRPQRTSWHQEWKEEAIEEAARSIKREISEVKRAVLYCRVSTGDQHVETQLYDLREMAK
jgi:predicted site-specific integrase-resolvase